MMSTPTLSMSRLPGRMSLMGDHIPIADQSDRPTCAAVTAVTIAAIYQEARTGERRHFSVPFSYSTSRMMAPNPPTWGTKFEYCVSAWQTFGMLSGGIPYPPPGRLNVHDLDPTDHRQAASYVRKGLPLAVVIPLDTSLLQTTHDDPVLRGPGPADVRIASHCLTAVGVNREGSLLVRNSWGTGWGYRGLAWIPAALLEQGYVQKIQFVDVEGLTSPRRST